MHGNVGEWCADVYARDFYEKSPAKNPLNTAGGKNRVARGGSCVTPAPLCRAAARFNYGPAGRLNSVGLRAACVGWNP
jgi:formylglycine-generating enzyme required for sulfatase activity